MSWASAPGPSPTRMCSASARRIRRRSPEGALHPRRIASGVVHGVEDYGNKMGIPTVNGAVLYHEGYTANPLVFCGCLGLLPHGSHPTGAQPGDLIIVLGGRTGRDGLRGATFSSMEMDASTGQVAGSAVQIGNPIQEKQVQEVILRARDAGCYHAITDCGAGGLSSAVGEMAAGTGAAVQLETVPLKYPGLRSLGNLAVGGAGTHGDGRAARPMGRAARHRRLTGCRSGLHRRIQCQRTPDAALR